MIQSATCQEFDGTKRTSRLASMLLVLCFFGGVPWLFAHTGGLFFVDGDCYAYAEVGQGLAQGRPLYSGVWMDKPPLAMLFFAATQWVWPHSPNCLQIALGIVLAMQASFILLATNAPLPARLAASLWLVLLPLTRKDFLWLSTEHLANLFLVPCLVIAFNAISDRRLTNRAAATLGLGMVLAFHCRQNSLLLSGAASLVVLRVERTELARRCGWYTVGLVAGFVLMLTAAARVGDFRSYLYVTYLYPLGYGAAAGPTVTAAYISEQFSASIVRNALLLTSLACATRHRWLVLASAIAASAAITAPMKPYSHYFAQLLPVYALAVLAILSNGFDRRRWLAFAVVLVLTLLLARSAIRDIRKWSSRMEHARLDRVAEAFDHAGRADDRLFVVGPPMPGSYLYFKTAIAPANAHFWDMQLDGYWATLLHRPASRILAEYRSSPPTIIAITAEDWAHFNELGTLSDKPNVSQIVTSFSPRDPAPNRLRQCSVENWLLLRPAGP